MALRIARSLAPGVAAALLGLVAPPAGAAPPRTIDRPKPHPALPADAAGYCQRTEFLGWSEDGTQAAYSESYCRSPPPDAAFDALNLVARDGTILRRIVGKEAGATLPPETRARLLLERFHRREGAKAPDGRVAKAAIAGTTLRLEVPGTAAFSAPLVLPYAAWALAAPPTVAGIYWAPDSRAVAVEVRAVRREPGGGSLTVGAVYFAEAPPVKAGPAPGKTRTPTH